MVISVTTTEVPATLTMVDVVADVESIEEEEVIGISGGSGSNPDTWRTFNNTRNNTTFIIARTEKQEYVEQWFSKYSGKTGLDY